MRLSENAKKVLEDKDCQRIFRQFIESNQFGDYAVPRARLLFEILQYKKLAPGMHLAHAHLLYQRFFEVRQVDPNEPPQMSEHLKAIKGILFQNEEGTDQNGLISDKLFDSILSQWLDLEISQWWKILEEDPSAFLSKDEVKQIQRIYPDFKVLSESSKQSAAKSTKSEDSQKTPKLKRSANSIAQPHLSTDKSRSNSSDDLLSTQPTNLSPGSRRKTTLAGIKAPFLKRSKSKISSESTSPTTSPPTSKKKYNTQSQSFFKLMEQTFSVPIETWTIETVSCWLVAIGMRHYSDRFIEHSISGSDLLELEESDWVNMEIDSKDVAIIKKLIAKSERFEQSVSVS